MKLREYYALQFEHIRSMQNSLASDGKGTKAAAPQKVRPLIMGGLLNLSILEPKIADLLIKTTVWVEGTIDDLKAMLDRDAGPASELGSVHDKRIATVTVGVGTLDPLIGKTWKEFKVSTHLAQSWVRNGFAGLKGMAKSAQLLIGIGSLYLLNDAMGKNLKAAKEAIGEKSPEASLALQGSTLAVLGAGIEVTGAALKGGATGMQVTGILSPMGSEIARTSMKLGTIVMRVGAVVIAMSGFFDAAQAGFAVRRTFKDGDVRASRAYVVAGVFYGVGAVAGVTAAAYGIATIFSLLGAAIVFGLIGYMLYRRAHSLESTLLERWARRCFFGYANEIPKVHWCSFHDASTAIAELNSVVIGVQADLNFKNEFVVSSDSVLTRPGQLSPDLIIAESFLTFKIRLPSYNQDLAAYSWKFIIHRTGDGDNGIYYAGQIVGQEDYSTPAFSTPGNQRVERLAESKSLKKNDYENEVIASNNRLISNPNTLEVFADLEVSGSVRLLGTTSYNSIEASTLILTYWPDRSLEQGYAEIEIAKVRKF